MANSGPSAAQSESSTLARRPGGGAKAYVSSLPLTVAIFVEKLRHLLFLNRAFEPARARADALVVQPNRALIQEGTLLGGRFFLSDHARFFVIK